MYVSPDCLEDSLVFYSKPVVRTDVNAAHSTTVAIGNAGDRYTPIDHYSCVPLADACILVFLRRNEAADVAGQTGCR